MRILTRLGAGGPPLHAVLLLGPNGKLQAVTSQLAPETALSSPVGVSLVELS
jgi:hypothetical protein